VNDFSKDFTALTFESLYNEKLADIDISILCNNVGMVEIGPFTEMKEQDVHNMVTVNCYPVVLLTKQIIKSFKKRHQANSAIRSAIVNTSSMISHGPTPLG
jgi:17beta-estradiol 17-dehydrogenase / very-long-chain 3-oxoacyl-CoA reductase